MCMMHREELGAVWEMHLDSFLPGGFSPLWDLKEGLEKMEVWSTIGLYDITKDIWDVSEKENPIMIHLYKLSLYG